MVAVVYDGDGNRVSETIAGVTTQYLVDTQNPTGYAQVVDEIQNGSVGVKWDVGFWEDEDAFLPQVLFTTEGFLLPKTNNPRRGPTVQPRSAL